MKCRKIILAVHFAVLFFASAAFAGELEDFIDGLINNGSGDSVRILNSFAASMSENSAVFKRLSAAAGNGHTHSQFLLGQYYAEKNNNDKALEFLRAAAENQEHRAAMCLLAVTLMKEGKKTGREALYDEALITLARLKKTVTSGWWSPYTEFLMKACYKNSPERKKFAEMYQ
jgi:TPR repeat protein